MFRIRRIHDDVVPGNQAALREVQEMWRAQFPDVPGEIIDALPEQLRDPLTSKLRTLVLVAEVRDKVAGFAILMHAPDLSFCYLDFITAGVGTEGQGVGGALYERAREEAHALDAIGLFLECPPDDPDKVTDPSYVAQNAARLRFYERYGARPIAHNHYDAPVRPGDKDMPYLVLDPLRSGRELSRDTVRAIVRAILERKYKWLCPPEYVESVVASFEDDPVELRPRRYTKSRGVERRARSVDLSIAWITSKDHSFHHVRERGYVEAPVRVSAIERELARLPIVQRIAAHRHGMELVAQVHDRDFLHYLANVCRKLPEGKSVYPYVFPVRNQTRPPADLAVRAGYYCIDTFTPLTRNAWQAARAAVNCALTGAEALLFGTRLAYALVRPPGHHAERRVFGGFCYLNNAAIAAQRLSAHGSVAIIDIDYHHGNGQQDIFYARSDVLTVSLHGDPSYAYPYFTGFADERGEGDGAGFNLNRPLREDLDAAGYLDELRHVLGDVTRFGPRFIVVCLGLDTARGDPTGSFGLTPADFLRVGRELGALSRPTLVVQEGGYLTRTLGINARHFFRGLWEGHTGRPMPDSERRS
jgi:acetoin utilization deacetylase AcuC-like enzyme/GNAT superfamily N-acetyltransferase